jgi:hypothetical protein
MLACRDAVCYGQPRPLPARHCRGVRGGARRLTGRSGRVVETPNQPARGFVADLPIPRSTSAHRTRAPNDAGNARGHAHIGTYGRAGCAGRWGASRTSAISNRLGCYGTASSSRGRRPSMGRTWLSSIPNSASVSSSARTMSSIRQNDARAHRLDRIRVPAPVGHDASPPIGSTVPSLRGCPSNGHAHRACPSSNGLNFAAIVRRARAVGAHAARRQRGCSPMMPSMAS